MKKIEQIKNAKTLSRLDELVTNELTNRDEYDNARGETYLETAERVREVKPELADFMVAVENRWFELDD